MYLDYIEINVTASPCAVSEIVVKLAGGTPGSTAGTCKAS